MATGGGNLYPNWLGSASLTLPTNSVNTTVTIPGQSNYTTYVNVVPQVILSSISTTVLNTNNPSEMISYIAPTSGWYKSEWNGSAFHDSASNWNSMAQLTWFMKRNNADMSNTITLIEPQYTCGDTVSERISMPGCGVISANAGDILEWVTDANAVGGGVITTGFSSGFGWITIQKIA